MTRRTRIASVLAINNIALSLLPLGICGALAFAFMYAELKGSSERAFRDAAVLVTAQVSTVLTTPSRLVAGAAASLGRAGASVDVRSRDLFLGGLKDGYSAFSRLDLFGPGGTVLATYPDDPDRVGDSGTGREFYRRAAAGGLAWSSVFIDAISGAPTVAVASGGPDGVLAGYVDLSTLGSLVSDFGVSGGYMATVIDADGIYIAHPDQERVARRESARLVRAVAEARPDAISTSTETEGGRRLLCAALKDPDSGWTVALFLDEDLLFRPARLFLAAWGLVLLATATAAALFASAVARRGARPFVDMARFAEAMGEGGSLPEMPDAPFEELSGVAEALAAGARKVSQREAELRESLRERDVLTREVHHRVKNNLAVLLGLLSLAERDASPDALTIFADLRRRVFAMSSVHELSYAHASVTELPASEYIATILESAVGEGGPLTSRLDCDDIALPLEIAVPFGLTVNELVVNAVKYAYPEGSGGEIRVTFRRSGGTLTLSVADDGVGLRPAGPDEQVGTGIELVGLLAEQLGGSFTLASPERGVEARVEFPDRSA